MREREIHTRGEASTDHPLGEGLGRKNFLKISEGKTERRKDVKTERRSFLWVVEELTFLKNGNK